MASVSSATLLLLVFSALVYFTSRIIYRLFLSPVAKFPGPKLAAASFWYEGYYDCVKGGQYMWKIKELHKQYGPIVRINPREIHIDDPEFHDQIYSRDGKWDKWDFYVDQFGSRLTEVFTIPHELHRMRRASVNPYFSKAKVNALEPMLRRFVEKLCNRLENSRGSDKTVPLRLAYECLTMDIVTEYVMCTSYNCLDDPTFNAKYHDMINNIGAVGHLAKQVPIINRIIQSLPSWLLLKLDPRMALYVQFQEESEAQAAKILRLKASDPDSKQHLSEKIHTTVFHDILLKSSLPESEKSLWRMRREAMQFVSAGTDTISNTMHVMTWHVYNSPYILEKLRRELKTVPSNPPLKDLEALPYLTGIIYEALRLGYGVTNRTARVAPDRVIKYKDWTIPPGTPVSLSAAFMHLNEAIFLDPEKFDPQRWTDPKERQRLDRYMVAFSKGTRSCLGINLAWAELYLITAFVFSRFDFEFRNTTYEDHVRLAADMYFPHPKRDTGETRVVVR